MAKSHIVVRSVVVDRLVFVLGWCVGFGGQKDQDQRMPGVKRILKRGMAHGRCAPAYFNQGRYLLSFKVLMPSGAEALVQIGAKQPDRQKGGIRISLNPSKLAAGDIDCLHRTMNRIVGPSYRELLKNPLINELHFALDIEGLKMNRLIVRRKRNKRFTVFGKDIDSRRGIETINFGSQSSDYMDAVYAKDVEQRHAAVIRLLKAARSGGAESLAETALRQLKVAHGMPPLVRVEIRCKKLRGKKVTQIAEIPNRFGYLAMHVLGGPTKVPAHIVEAFIALCRERGVKYALHRFKGTEHARGLHKFLRDAEANWWNPRRAWRSGLKAFRELAIFPEQAFETDDE